MSNSFFKFKQFTILQDKAAMKVCTDSCIFGAYINPGKAKRILDIGTGTGLLALMVAQRTDAEISAVEIDTESYTNAVQNISESPWKSRINLYNTSIQEFTIKQTEQFDLIVCNPPFFSAHLKSPDPKRNLAIHNVSLSQDDLINSIKKLLSKNGRCYILLPEYESNLLEDKAAREGLYINEKLIIKDTNNSKTIRNITLFSFHFTNSYSTNSFIIKNNNGIYTEEFNQLLKDYYLYL